MVHKPTSTGRVIKLSEIVFIRRAAATRKLARPLFSTRVSAGFSTPAEHFVEGRIDLNQELIKHPLATFYVRVSGDSMTGAGIYPGALPVVDRAEETREGHIVVARINDELCVKRFSFGDDGRIRLLSANDLYAPIVIRHDCDFEVWGRVMHAVQSF